MPILIVNMMTTMMMIAIILGPILLQLVFSVVHIFWVEEAPFVCLCLFTLQIMSFVHGR